MLSNTGISKSICRNSIKITQCIVWLYVTHWILEAMGCNFTYIILQHSFLLLILSFSVKMALGECKNTALVTSQHWFGQWLGAVGQQSIIWTIDRALEGSELRAQGHKNPIGPLWNFTWERPSGHHIDGLVQERRNSSANTLELRLSCTNPSIWHHQGP